MITSTNPVDEVVLARAFGWPTVTRASADGTLRGPIEPLTGAEQRVLSLLLEGLSNKEISTLLGRAEPTIKHQVSACLRKFGVPSRSRLVAVVR
ncbi:MAG: helix-turn-helix transcriptional regulator [Verrucomicrobia bacterium]|nr:helix-turn-helix transcriptional regulator [Verrucomicrobiota bacterium]